MRLTSVSTVSQTSWTPANATHAARTYPVTGTFTGPQRDLYAAVLSAQKQLIELCTESARYSLHNLHRKSVDLLKQELNQLGFGIMGGDLERVLYPHYLSHSIGVGQSSLGPVILKT
jgi:intermediate cleaving peptidase 55